MQRSNSPLKQFILLIIVAAVGLGISLAVRDGLFYAYKTGMFSSWKFLDGFGWMKRLLLLFCMPTGLILSVIIFVVFQKGEARQLTLDVIFHVFSVIGYATVGAVIGLLVGSGILMLEGSGAFVSWEPFDNSIKFSQIVRANTQTVWAQSNDGKLYSWDTNCYTQSMCNEWVEVKSIPDDTGYDYMLEHGLIKKGTSCQLGRPDSPGKQPGNIVECVLVLGVGEAPRTVYYALLDDGTIWYWNNTVFYDATSFIIIEVISILVGALLGAITGIIIVVARYKRKKQPQLIIDTREA